MLEVILSVVIIAVILLLAGVPLVTILSWLAVFLLGTVVLAMLLFVLFFVIADISLLMRRRVRGKYVRIDDSGRFERAVYEYGGEEYICQFPAENLGRSRLYREDRDYLLLIPRRGKRKTAFDRHSIAVIAVGTVFSVLFAAVLVIGAMFVLRQFAS